MAKGKHSTALFEVIHSGKRPEKAAQSLRTPKWWFKGRPKSAQVTPAPAQAYDPEPAHEPERYEPVEAPVETPSRPSPRERSSGVQFGFDRGSQELTFKLRYTTALVTAFSVCVLVGLSYVIGRHLGGGPKVASGEQASVKELLQQPAQPDVTKVTPKTRVNALTQTPAPRTSTPATPTSEKATGLANTGIPARQRVVSSLIPASADTSTPRKPGLNYLVIQIYPEDRRANAEAAREFFTKNGIPCTIEKTGWTMGKWLTLIGTAGFTKVSSEDFKTYVERAAAIAKAYKSSNFDHPEPTTSSAYKWRATDGAPN